MKKEVMFTFHYRFSKNPFRKEVILKWEDPEKQQKEKDLV